MTYRLLSTFLGSSIIYSQTFASGTIPSAQCTAWHTFRSQLVVRPYTSLTIRGSNDPTGITLTNPTYIAGIANALQTYTAYGPVTANGYTWVVGNCAVSGIQYELSATGATCSCATGYVVRPCIGNSNWGGINGATCSGGTQTMIVIFQ